MDVPGSDYSRRLNGRTAPAWIRPLAARVDREEQSSSHPASPLFPVLYPLATMQPLHGVPATKTVHPKLTPIATQTMDARRTHRAAAAGFEQPCHNH